MVIALYVLIGLGLIAAVWGGVWFLRIAFNVSFGWGIACLLIPFAGIVFLVKRWEKCRLPFFVNFVGLLVLVIATLALAGYQANAEVRNMARIEWDDLDYQDSRSPGATPWWEEQPAVREYEERTRASAEKDVDPGPSPGPVTTAEAPENESVSGIPDDQVDEDSDGGDAAEGAATTFPTPTPLPHWLRPWGVGLDRQDYESAIETYVKVYTTDGQVFKAILVDVNDNGIRVRQRVGSGWMSFSLRYEVINEVRVRD